MKTLRLSLIAALALGGLLACTTLASAQDAKEGKKGAGRGMNVQQRVDRISEELKLNDEQKTKIKALFEAEAKQMQEMRGQNSTLTQEQRREKFQAMRTESDKKLKEILTADQFKKWEEMRQQMRQKGPGGDKKGGKKEN